MCNASLLKMTRGCFAKRSQDFTNPRLASPGDFASGRRGVAALARLGFSTDDSEGNYQRLIPLDGSDDFAGVADVILTALYEAYGARMDSKLEWQAPLAPGKGLFARCAPVS